MAAKEKKVRKYSVGKESSRKMRNANLATLTGLYERFCKYKQTEGMSFLPTPKKGVITWPKMAANLLKMFG
ncbi:hypothetical protein [Cytobacillus firmus]|uniref:hypothetical protein n=1 Tax=Cytobacillus firmus TaxID=1399 RepID=UPI002030AF64|nr:hypothetical protein [Cytobacillus firmus]URT72716.1 hypothetical protein NAF01_09820 [Cytobacillus firmus]